MTAIAATPSADPITPTSAAVTVRPFTPDDYPALCELSASVFPEHRSTPGEMRHADENRDARCHWARWVACDPDEGGTVVGEGLYSHMSYLFHPRKFSVWVMVRPDRQGRGIGRALYEHVLGALASFDPILLRTFTQEDRPRSLRFLRDRGFVEEMRSWESRLDVNAFDPAPFAHVAGYVAAQNIVIKTERELATDPDRDRKMYDLVMALERDVPAPEPITPPPFDEWAKRFSNPNHLPDANFVALDTTDGDRYVGYSSLHRRQADDHLDTGLTGVLPSHRRRKIALAMKLRAIEYARSIGSPVIRTGNETNNRAMLSINEMLGFVKQPAWIEFVKHLKAPADEPSPEITP